MIVIKVCAARVNAKNKIISQEIADSIIKAGIEFLKKSPFEMKEFPLSIWQTGSGTQTNMNVNEVLAFRANQILDEKKKNDVNKNEDKGSEIKNNKKEKNRIHPNDHVNKAQSSNDTFPTGMQIAVWLKHVKELRPRMLTLLHYLKEKEESFKMIKVGRTHMQDATPIVTGQEFSGFVGSLSFWIKELEKSADNLMFLAQGGTAVGTGLNCYENFDSDFCEALNDLLSSEEIFNLNDEKKKIQEVWIGKNLYLI